HELHRLRRLAEKVRWLSFSSPDFALFRENAAAKPDAERSYRVQVGVDAKSSLPRLAIVHEETPGAKAAPMLVQLERYEKVDGFWVPHQILVYRLVRTDGRVAFEEKPAQEIYVTRATLRPGLKPTDFEP
ncbi:MAG: hypothetical protein O7B99_06870, partial [Planctomycetota bacterium]|nr:hypothetical protein [Planctomycetota bacterium]